MKPNNQDRAVKNNINTLSLSFNSQLKRASFYLLAALFILSCRAKETTVENVLSEPAFQLKIASIKRLTKQTYYTLGLKTDKTLIKFDYNGNRENVMGPDVKDLGFADKKDTVNTTTEKLEKLKDLLIKASKDKRGESLLGTVIYMKSKSGFSRIIIENDELSTELMRFIQFELLDNKVKI